MLMGLLAKGHILIEGVPGLAKTSAVKALAATIDAKDEYGNNVIWRATYAFKGVGELIKLLLANGANPNLTNNNNVSAIDLANRIGKDSLIELFN